MKEFLVTGAALVVFAFAIAAGIAILVGTAFLLGISAFMIPVAALFAFVSMAFLTVMTEEAIDFITTL